MKFKRGDQVVYCGEHSYFAGFFLGYLDKFAWSDPEGSEHASTQTCAVQQYGTGIVFIKPIPTEENRP